MIPHLSCSVLERRQHVIDGHVFFKPATSGNSSFFLCKLSLIMLHGAGSLRTKSNNGYRSGPHAMMPVQSGLFLTNVVVRKPALAMANFPGLALDARNCVAAKEDSQIKDKMNV